MKTLNIFSGSIRERNIPYPGYFLFLLLVLLWPVMQHFLASDDHMVGYLDPNIWLLMLMSIICFFAIVGLVSLLLKQFWISLGLPALANMVLQFKKMELWQQLGFYWLSFALLLLVAVGVLAAIM